MRIAHTLWLFDLAGADAAFKTKAEVQKFIQGAYLDNMLDDAGAPHGIASASVRWVSAAEVIAPAKFDAVVFVVPDVRYGLLKRVGGSTEQAMQDTTVFGTTALDHPMGGMAEVYWERCKNTEDAASSILHEAAHLKSGQSDKMHSAKDVRIFSKTGTGRSLSWGDIDFYKAAIRRPVKLRTRVPAAR
jgi:hypothetical protein